MALALAVVLHLEHLFSASWKAEVAQMKPSCYCSDNNYKIEDSISCLIFLIFCISFRSPRIRLRMRCFMCYVKFASKKKEKKNRNCLKDWHRMVFGTSFILHYQQSWYTVLLWYHITVPISHIFSPEESASSRRKTSAVLIEGHATRHSFDFEVLNVCTSVLDNENQSRWELLGKYQSSKGAHHYVCRRGKTLLLENPVYMFHPSPGNLAVPPDDVTAALWVLVGSRKPAHIRAIMFQKITGTLNLLIWIVRLKFLGSDGTIDSRIQKSRQSSGLHTVWLVNACLPAGNTLTGVTAGTAERVLSRNERPEDRWAAASHQQLERLKRGGRMSFECIAENVPTVPYVSYIMYTVGSSMFRDSTIAYCTSQIDKMTLV